MQIVLIYEPAKPNLFVYFDTLLKIENFVWHILIILTLISSYNSCHRCIHTSILPQVQDPFWWVVWSLITHWLLQFVIPRDVFSQQPNPWKLVHLPGPHSYRKSQYTPRKESSIVCCLRKVTWLFTRSPGSQLRNFAVHPHSACAVALGALMSCHVHKIASSFSNDFVRFKRQNVPALLCLIKIILFNFIFVSSSNLKSNNFLWFLCLLCLFLLQTEVFSVEYSK